MFSGGIGSLLGGLGTLLGGGGGGRSPGLGGGSSGGGGGIMDMLGGLIKPFAPMLPALANMAGTAIGGAYGGPAGAALGGNLAGALGGSFANLLNGNQNTQPSSGMNFSQFPDQANQFGNQLNQRVNQYLPPQFQNQNFGNLGGALGDYFGQRFGAPELGNVLGNMANPYIQKYIPENIRNVSMGNIGGYAADQMNNRFNQGMQSMGFQPYNSIPQAPPIGDLYSRAPGGGMGGYGGNSSGGGSYGSIPQAPAPGDVYNRAPGGFSGGYNRLPEVPMAPTFNASSPGGPSPYSFPMQEQSDRGALLNDIRSYRRPSYSAPANDGYSGYSAPSIPQAPDAGNLFSRAPGGMMSSSMHPAGPRNIFSEFQQRASQPGMGLRPTETRAAANYPTNSGVSMMDLLRNSLNARRDVIEPESPNRAYTVRGGY